MACPSIGHHFDNLALKSPTRIENLGCCLLIPESTSIRFSQKDSSGSWFWHVKKHLSLIIVTSVTRHSFNLPILILLVNTLYNIYKHVIFLCYFDDLILLLIISVYSFSLLYGIVESKNVSDKQMILMLLALLNASIKGTLTKSWAAILLRFLWQKLNLEDF